MPPILSRLTRSLALLLCIQVPLILSSPAQAEPLRMLVMGDSFMTSNASRKEAVPHILARSLGAQVKSTAVTGARYGYKLPITGALGLNIAKQYRKGAWDVVVLNGGGNDLWLGCGCYRCRSRLDRMISKTGETGQIVQTVRRARQSGARVIYVGYLRSPGVGSLIDHCRKWGDALEARLTKMAARDAKVSFVSLADLVPHGDRSFHAADLIHPSPKGSRAASKRIVEAIRDVLA